MTVSEAFSKLYGPIPDGATCHIGVEQGSYVLLRPTYSDPSKYEHPSFLASIWSGGKWQPGWNAVGASVSDHPATSFVGLGFGREYDELVRSTVIVGDV